ncbi:Uncharacterised protein [Vibrio cholerae]|nr:Uncharacterised protein [Vibrio cholerae]CSI17757.1 Uncharacterised protein [Vibrio cholerae]
MIHNSKFEARRPQLKSKFGLNCLAVVVKDDEKRPNADKDHSLYAYFPKEVGYHFHGIRP